MGMSALRKRSSPMNVRRFLIAPATSSGESTSNSSSSIDRMKALARLCCWANELRSP
ncbi:Uncharacterised protein [Bordetella pertussis]|nr:Uncharacterised protein [Bordetella pertussis]CPL51462.1 Uncharacterised protein [Bordetella pertussis]CPN80846.1 Uncharacterised protein [Bordetella pertussis]